MKIIDSEFDTCICIDKKVRKRLMLCCGNYQFGSLFQKN